MQLVNDISDGSSIYHKNIYEPKLKLNFVLNYSFIGIVN